MPGHHLGEPLRPICNKDNLINIQFSCKKTKQNVTIDFVWLQTAMTVWSKRGGS